MTEAQLNAKYGAFVVTRYDANRMRSVPVGKRVYATVAEASAACGRWDPACTRPPRMVDLASVYGLSLPAKAA